MRKKSFSSTEEEDKRSFRYRIRIGRFQAFARLGPTTHITVLSPSEYGTMMAGDAATTSGFALHAAVEEEERRKSLKSSELGKGAADNKQ